MDVISLERRLKEKRRPCIWMQAEVVRSKNCLNNYNCHVCPFDRALRRVCNENAKRIKQGKASEGRQGRLVFWKDRLKKRPPSKRPCLHHMKGRIGFKACSREYRCIDCEFDQYFDDQYTVHAAVEPVEFINVEGIKVPHGFYFHRGHTWVKVEEGSDVRIGLDDFILRVLGPPDHIEAPLTGKVLAQDADDILLSRGKNRARVLSPISGVVTAVNADLRHNGRQAHQDPYADGWILRAHAKDLRKDLSTLLIGSETEEFYKGEVNRLYRAIEVEAGPLAADGGRLGTDIYGNMPRIGWDRLVKRFLHTQVIEAVSGTTL